MKKTVFILLLSLFVCINFTFADSIANDAKKAIKEYAGFNELKNRGFDLKMLDKITSAEDLYNVLLPYMIVDGKSLDNTISFNGYNFNRHKSIKFENVYGTIGELLNKGYKPEQLFYYPCKGDDFYRVGNFVWETPKTYSQGGSSFCYYNRPFTGKRVAYFFPYAFIKDFFKPHIKEIQKKEAIVVDLRLCSGGWGQLYSLGELLCQANYKGKVIFIIDSTTGSDCESNIKNNLRSSYFINGTQKQVGFEWITVGENTSGSQKYPYNAKWGYKVGELQFSPLPVEQNEWACCEEGEGINPDIWAYGDDDINKTIELLTGETGFEELIKDVSEWRNYLCSSDKAVWNLNYKIPDVVQKIKSNEEYNKTITKIMKTQIQYNTILNEHRNELYNIGGYWYEIPDCAFKTKNVDEYITAYSKFIESKIKLLSLITKDTERYKNTYYTYWELPECISNCTSFTNYADYFSRWMDLRIWWCNVLMDNQYVLENNNIPVWSDAIKEQIKEWKNPEKHIDELTAYLKETKAWIEYLQPHPYVIPDDMGMAKLYNAMRRTSNKIGKGCTAVPVEIRDLQKSDPKAYVDKMVDYINSVAENDFERVKLVFDIEQEILTYDHATYQKDLKKIRNAAKGVGEDYQLYRKNMNESNKNDTEKRAKQDWKTVLESGVCVCEGYSRLMQYFCYRMGIKCDIISNPEDMMFAVGHAWNIVVINGEDYCLDATWGHAYLFMEPKEFLSTGHFPKEKEQQLLVQPMTLDEYKKLKNYKGNTY